MVDRLVEIIEAELPLYKELLALLQQEKELLGRRAGDELYNLTQRIESLVYRLMPLERARAEALGELAAALGVEARLGEVIARLGEPDRARLKGLQSTFLALADAIVQLSRHNSVVIGRGIENIRHAFLYLKGFATTNAQTYGPGGPVCDAYGRRG